MTIGRRNRATVKGFILSGRINQRPGLVSSEVACILNRQRQEAHIAISLSFNGGAGAHVTFVSTVAYPA